MMIFGEVYLIHCDNFRMELWMEVLIVITTFRVQIGPQTASKARCAFIGSRPSAKCQMFPFCLSCRPAGVFSFKSPPSPSLSSQRRLWRTDAKWECMPNRLRVSLKREEKNVSWFTFRPSAINQAKVRRGDPRVWNKKNEEREGSPSSEMDRRKKFHLSAAYEAMSCAPQIWGH